MERVRAKINEIANKAENGNIKHWVLVMFISPVSGFEFRTGYFDEYYLADEFYHKMLDMYKSLKFPFVIYFDGQYMESVDVDKPLGTQIE